MVVELPVRMFGQALGFQQSRRCPARIVARPSVAPRSTMPVALAHAVAVVCSASRWSLAGGVPGPARKPFAAELPSGNFRSAVSPIRGRPRPVAPVPGDPMAEFSLQPNEDQLQIQKWVHDFADDVMRPAAHEWDEREEFPWPIVQEAAKIGLYGVRLPGATLLGDPTGLTLPVAIEELFWGDAGIGLAIMGSALAAAGIAGNGTPEQVMEWVPQCYGTPTTSSSARSA